MMAPERDSDDVSDPREKHELYSKYSTRNRSSSDLVNTKKTRLAIIVPCMQCDRLDRAFE